jgi:nucleoside-diphosphate-sugar epimerase
MRTNVVTGGAGFFGELMATLLLERGEKVISFDLNLPGIQHKNLQAIQGDVRDLDALNRAFVGSERVFHNVAQVPLAKDKSLFWSVNHDGTRKVVDAALGAGVKKLVYTSSSAVFGVPRSNPVTEDTSPTPAEDYGRAKLAGEEICRDAAGKGLDISIIRPRTILGHGLGSRSTISARRNSAPCANFSRRLFGTPEPPAE